jgi:hypothetical protein
MYFLRAEPLPQKTDLLKNYQHPDPKKLIGFISASQFWRTFSG